MKLLVSAGERSGDEHAARVIAALNKLLSGELQCKGMGGDALRKQNVELLVDFETHGSVMGISEVLKTLPRHLRELSILTNALKTWKPDAVLLVDYAEFNSIIAKKAKKLGIPAYHFIPPQAWGWREGRVEAMKRNLIGAGVLFPFEEEFYHERGFTTAKFLGHPLVEVIPEQESKKEIRKKLNVSESATVIALFPGSRKEEIRRHLPTFIEAVSLVKNEVPNVIPIVAASKALDKNSIPSDWRIHEGDSIEVLKAADVGLIKSGTSNLQAALCGLPFAMLYKTSLLSECVGRIVLTISNYSIVNLLIPGTIREFIQRDTNPQNICNEILRLLNNQQYREEILNRFKKIRAALSEKNQQHRKSPQENVAEHFLELLSQKRPPDKLNIALLGTRGIPGRYGGFETFADELSARLVRSGHHVTVYGRTSLFGFERGDYQGVSVVKTGTIFQKYAETPVHAITSNFHAIFQSYDVALVCNAANSPFAWMLRLRGIPVVINVDGIERKRSKWSLAGRLWYRLGEICSVLFASRIVADAEVISEYYQEKFKTNPAVIAYGHRESPRPAGEALKKFGLSEQKYILYVSRFEPENHPLEVVKAYRDVKTDLPLVMVGDAPYAKEYIELVKQTADERVIFTGYQFGEVYEELLSNCSVYIQATEVGGTHPALVEAMGYGRCIIANDVPEHREVLDGSGVLYEKNNHVSLTEKLSELLQSTSAREELATKAKSRAVQRYNWNKVTDDYENLLQSVVQKSS